MTTYLRRVLSVTQVAAALHELDQLRSKRVAVIQTGGNIDHVLFAEVLADTDPDLE